MGVVVYHKQLLEGCWYVQWLHHIAILGHSKSIISFWLPKLSQVHAGGRVVRTMGL